MDELLDNPVYFALLTGDAHRGAGTSHVKYFDEQISPFAGFEEDYTRGFDELHALLPPHRKILYATRKEISEPKGWKLIQHIAGFQFILSELRSVDIVAGLVPLQKQHVQQMVELAKLTRPGPFNVRTIEFGHYSGIFDNDKLVSMNGQRLHVANYTEISAVCTHPDYSGKGYATALLKHQLQLIINTGQVPFLHVRSDNKRAIALYERFGFKENGEMNFLLYEKRIKTSSHKCPAEAHRVRNRIPFNKLHFYLRHLTQLH